MKNNSSTYQTVRLYITEKWRLVKVKKVTAILALIGLAFTVFAAIKTNFFYKSANLVAKGDYLYFEAKNDFSGSNTEVGFLEREKIEELLPQKSERYLTAYNIISYIQSVQTTVPVERLDSLSVFMTLDIENAGTQEAQNVELTLPVKGFCKIIRTGERAIFTQIDNNQIKIGNVQPTDRVLVAVWGDKPTDDYGKSIINLTDSYATRLQYNSDEVAYITFPTKIGNFEAWLRKQLSFFFPMILMCGLATAGTLIIYVASSSREDNEIS